MLADATRKLEAANVSLSAAHARAAVAETNNTEVWHRRLACAPTLAV
jgi:hypothetical protein